MAIQTGLSCLFYSRTRAGMSSSDLWVTMVENTSITFAFAQEDA